jgi:hypothetical protein
VLTGFGGAGVVEIIKDHRIAVTHSAPCTR